MKTKIMKFYMLLVATIAAAMTVSCNEPAIEMGNEIDEGIYENVGIDGVFLRDVATFETAAFIEFYGNDTSGTAAVEAGIQKAATANVTGTVSVDEEWLAVYNEKNDTRYELLPADMAVTLAGEGAFTIETGSLFSTSVGVTVAAPSTIDETGTVYALPLAVTTSAATSGVGVNEADSHVMYLVRDRRSLGTTDKGEGKPQWVAQWDGANPLNTLAWELENGKLLFDYTVLFSVNINYDSDQARCYLNYNPEMSWALSNRETVIVPLQERGSKVIMGLLNNHDSAALEGLSEAGAKDFAAQVARAVYAYGLDGVQIDTEWEGDSNQVRDAVEVENSPYLLPNSYYNMALLCHELKKAMPDKLIVSFEYDYCRVASMQDAYEPVTGIDVSEYIDMVLANYNQVGNPAGELTMNQCSQYTWISTEANWATPGFPEANYQAMVDSGRKYCMVFASRPWERPDNRPANDNFGNMWKDISGTGHEAAYGSALKIPTVYYKNMDTTPYPYTPAVPLN